ncbi:MAG TPA: type II secretion system protein [Patescibacteria group bacterium]|nr:type II secretion system protein [Patescibacteria group bacterium]
MKQNQKGYTLIELLAVLIVFIVISTFIVTIVFTALRGDTKVNSISTVRQNGNFVISQLARSIREAHAVITPSPCGTIEVPVISSNVTINTVTGDQITYSCGNGNIASNGAQLLDAKNITVTDCSFSCGQTTVKSPPIITISFSLKQTNVSTFTEFIASASAIPFQTSVNLRNTNL